MSYLESINEMIDIGNETFDIYCEYGCEYYDSLFSKFSLDSLDYFIKCLIISMFNMQKSKELMEEIEVCFNHGIHIYLRKNGNLTRDEVLKKSTYYIDYGQKVFDIKIRK